PEKWKKTMAKSSRNLGLEYTSVRTNKRIEARKIGPPCTCSFKCFEKVGQINIKTIFNDYWSSGSWDAQTAYLQKRTTTNPVKRRRKDTAVKGCTRSYHVSVDIALMPVCKTAFANIHGISMSRVDRAQSNMTASGVPIKDRRGQAGGSHCRNLKKRQISYLMISYLVISRG
ncbi:unnamed protein product, partial [Meganyctiphanes norvegica]